MSWWNIKDDQGGIRPPPVDDGGAPFDAATHHIRVRRAVILVNGDEPADLLDDCVPKIIAAWRREWGRPPTVREFHAALAFVIRPLNLKP